jgi:sugar O-acyltransferase (sialic acid O-acetyltransferase NeuD family)
MVKQIILIGAGGHAKSCLDVISTHKKKFKIIGLVDNKKNYKKILNLKILGKDKDLNKIFKKYKYALVAFGQIKTSKLRENCFKNLKKIGFKLPSIISKNSYFSKYSTIGEGSIVMHGVVVNGFSSIGKNCIINSNSTIEHDVIIGNNCHVAGGAIINGGTVIGDGTFIGSGTVLKQGIKIGKNCVISANTFLRKDIKDNKIFIK